MTILIVEKSEKEQIKFSKAFKGISVKVCSPEQAIKEAKRKVILAVISRKEFFEKISQLETDFLIPCIFFEKTTQGIKISFLQEDKEIFVEVEPEKILLIALDYLSKRFPLFKNYQARLSYYKRTGKIFEKIK